MATGTRKTTGTSRKSTSSGTRKTSSGTRRSSGTGTPRSSSARTSSGSSGRAGTSRRTSGSPARKTSSYSSRSTSAARSRANQDAVKRRDLLLILLFAGMVFLFLSCFGILGPAGSLFRSLMFGLAGFSAYFLPVFVFGAVLYYTAHEADPMMPSRLTGACGLFLIFSTVCELVSADLKNMPLYDLAGIYNRCSTTGKGGGILGGSIAFFLHHWFKFAGAVLILLILAAVCIVLISRESVIDAVGARAAQARSRSRERREYLEQLRQEEELRREEEEQYRLAHPEEFEEAGYDSLQEPFGREDAAKSLNGGKRRAKRENREYRYSGIVGDTRLDGYPESGPVLRYEIGPDGRAVGAYDENQADRATESFDKRQADKAAGSYDERQADRPDPEMQESYPEDRYADLTADAYPSDGYEDSGRDTLTEPETPRNDHIPLSEGDRLDPIGYREEPASTEKHSSGLFGRGKNTSRRNNGQEGSGAGKSSRPHLAGDIHEITVEDYLDSSYDSIQPLQDASPYVSDEEEDSLGDMIRRQSAMGVMEQNQAQMTADLITDDHYAEDTGSSPESIDPVGDDSAHEEETGVYEDIPYVPGKILTFDQRGHAVARSYESEEMQELAAPAEETGTIPLPKRTEGIGIVMDPVESHTSEPVPAQSYTAVQNPDDSVTAVQARRDAANATINAGGLKGTDSALAASSEALSEDAPAPISAVQSDDPPAAKPLKPRFEPKEYVYPPLDLLIPGNHDHEAESENELRETAARLQMTLKTFGVNVKITDISQGPAVTRYELLPELGVKVSKIVGLQDDIKLQLAATDIRIEAPIPGKSAIGIEVPNKTTSIVALRDILETPEFRTHKSRLAFGVGKDIAGKSVVTDIAKMPHVLIAGSTGSGKSVCINTIIMSILYHADPKEVKLIMIDPKVVELSVYNGIPHLMIPVVTNPQKASAALNWAVAEMDSRYRKFADAAVRDIKGYNALVKEREEAIRNGTPEEEAPGMEDMHFMPQLVVIVDELADLMMVAKNDVETAICRLAQLARAAGIHLIIATQRPSVDVITGLIKANMPSRIAFAVSSGVDSRTILDMYGAEKLLGKGDMLFFPQGMTKPARVQGAFVSDDEVNAVVRFVKQNNSPSENSEDIEKKIENLASGVKEEAAGESAQEVPESRFDELFEKAGKFIIEKNNASIGLLQRMYRIGFNRAARIMDQLCEAGVVGEAEGTKSRRILMTEMEFENFCRENEI